jgi:hypothetical protein
MHLIEHTPRVSQREIADKLGVSVGGINYCIKALVERGYIKISNFTESPDKLGYAYLLTPSGIAAKAALTGKFLKRKLDEYEALKAEIESLQAKPLQQRDQQVERGEKQGQIR